MSTQFFASAPDLKNLTGFDIPPSLSTALGAAFNYGESKNGATPTGSTLWNLNDGDTESCQPYWELYKIAQPKPKYYQPILNIFCNPVECESPATFKTAATVIPPLITVGGLGFRPTLVVGLNGSFICLAAGGGGGVGSTGEEFGAINLDGTFRETKVVDPEDGEEMQVAAATAEHTMDAGNY